MRFTLLIILSLFVVKAWGQNPVKLPYSPYGGVFTPKKTLKALIVFVTYKDKSAANPKFENQWHKVKDWDYTTENKLPNFVDPETGACPSYIFNTEEDFETQMDKVDNNFSKEFFLMSNGQFKFIGEVFKNAEGKPTVVEIDPTGGYSWTQMNGRAVEAMQKLNPNVDLSHLDQRKNRPNFQFDNSDTSTHKPDKIIDFVVFVHRYSKGWGEQPKPSMRGWIGSGGGFASTGVLPTNTVNNYRIAEGFTMVYPSGVFIHEVAHVLFNAPHIMGVNNVIGDFFSLMSAGWGVMAPISIFSGFNAWERWYAGFTELTADIKSEEDLVEKQIFRLRDYFTTGDAIRIEIPFSNGQHLWLENHTKQHPLDEHPWEGFVLDSGDTIRGTAKGVYAYVEAIEGSRHTIFSPVSNRANGIKVLHAGGNYDYHLYEELPVLKNRWKNSLWSFRKDAENPISGLNNFYRYPYDKNKDGIIKLDVNYNSSKTEQFIAIYREEVEPDSFVNLYGGFGNYDSEKSARYLGPASFQGGDYLDMGSNPMPLNYPKYNIKEKQYTPYILNGLGVKFMQDEGSDDIFVEVRFKQTQLCQNRRWTGRIDLPNITGDDAADLELSACTRLTIDRSATPNTHVKTAEGDFVIPTIFTVKKGATLHLRSKARLIIKADSKLIIEEGAKLILDKRAVITVEKGATLTLPEESLQKHPKASIKTP